MPDSGYCTTVRKRIGGEDQLFCDTLSIRAPVLIASFAIISGCGTYHNTISTVPSQFPRNQVAVMQCFSPCKEIIDDGGNIVGKNHPLSFTHGIIGKIELIPGHYSIKALKCDGYWPYSDNTYTMLELEARAGKNYYLTHDYKISGCYFGLNVSDSDTAIDQTGALRTNPEQWFFKQRKKANCGDPQMQYYIGVLYETGDAPWDRSAVIAYKWFKLAADGPRRREALPQLEGLRAKMSPQQIAEAERLVSEWQPDTEGCE